MSETSDLQRSSAAQDSSAGWGRTWDLCALVVPLLAMAPLVFREAAAIYDRQERWLAVLVPAFLLFAIPALLRRKGPDQGSGDEGFFRDVALAISGTAHTQPIRPENAGSPTLPRARWAIGLVCLSLLLFLLAVVWSAPWLATVAAIGTFGGWALGRMTRLHWPAIAAWCGLLLVALPLAGSWEVGLLRWMQWLAALLAGGVLDLLQVPHLHYGNLFELKDFLLRVDTACRGPFSFYGLAIVAAITMYLRGNSWVTTLLKFLTLPLWGIFLYTVRLLILLLAHHWYGRDLTTGTDYLLVAGASFAWAYLAYLIWDLILSAMLSPVPTEVPEMAKYYNRINEFLCWPNLLPLVDVSSTLEFEGSRPRRGEAKPIQPPPRIREWWNAPALAIPLALILIAAGFAGVTAAAVSLRSAGGLSTSLPKLTEEQIAALPGKDSLPETFESWLRVAFRREEIEPALRLAQESLAWDYLSGSRTATFQIDFPNRGVADLAYWYSQRGWEVKDIVSVSGKQSDAWPWLEMTLENSYGVRARVCFSCMTSTGKPYLALPTAKPLLEEAASSQARRPLTDGLRELAGEPAPICLQIHLFSDSLDIEKKLDLAEFRQLYEQLREKLVQDQAQRSWTIGFGN